MAPSAANQARRELAELRSMIDDARRELGLDSKPVQIAIKRADRQPAEARKSAAKRGRASVA